MRKTLARVLLVFGIFVILEGMTFAASWVESKNQGMQIRHPQGWKVNWGESVVGVIHPQNPMIWCMTRFTPAEGLSSRQVAEGVMQDATSRASDIRPVKRLQVSKRPDLYGIKFSGQGNGIPFMSLVLVITEDGRNFVIRQYCAPTKEYDEMKLTLIPILRSFCYQGGGGAGGVSASGGKGMQVLQSPRGFWRYMAPGGWRPVGNPMDEPVDAEIEPPDGSMGVRVMFSSASLDYREVLQARFGPNLGMTPRGRQMQFVPLMPAAQVFQQLLVPFKQLTVRNVKVESLNAVNNQEARYKISYDGRSGTRLVREGLILSSSLPFPNYGDFNTYTDYSISANLQKFESAKQQLWQILSTFESSPQFGAPLIQIFAKMRSENLQATTNMALQNMQTNKNIMQQHVAIAQQKPDMMAQQGQGWINAVTGQEAVRDPQSGQRWQVPVGGQYIYGRNTGEIIRADRPISQQDMPEGFAPFEAVK